MNLGVYFFRNMCYYKGVNKDNIYIKQGVVNMAAKKNYFTVVGLVYGKGLTELAQFDDRKNAEWHIKTTFSGLGYDKLLIKPTGKRNKDIIVTKRVAEDKDTYVHAKVGMSVLDWEKLDIATEFGSLLKFTLPSSGVLSSVREIGKLSEVVADALDKDGNIEKVSTTIVQSENTSLPLSKAKEALTHGIMGILLGSEDSVLEEVDLDEDEEIFEEDIEEEVEEVVAEPIVEEVPEVLEEVATVEEIAVEPLTVEPIVEEVPEILEEVAVVEEVVEVAEDLKTTLHAQDPSNLPERLKNMVEEVPEILEEVATVEEVVEVPVVETVVEPVIEEPIVEEVPEVLEEVAVVEEVVVEEPVEEPAVEDFLDILDEELTVEEPTVNEVSTISFNDLDNMDFDI